MNGLLIANKDQAARELMGKVFQGQGYQISEIDSVVNALESILDKSVQVVLLSGPLDEQHIAKFVPLLKKCNRNLSIILISDELPLELLRKIRKEGIFYHALKPAEREGWDEIRQVVDCAFKNYQERQETRPGLFSRKISLQGVTSSLFTLALMLVCAPHVLAMDTSKTYNSGLLVLLFVGFCALIIVVQLIPALLSLFGITKKGARSAAAKKQAAPIKNR